MTETRPAGSPASSGDNAERASIGDASPEDVLEDLPGLEPVHQGYPSYLEEEPIEVLSGDDIQRKPIEVLSDDDVQPGSDEPVQADVQLPGVGPIRVTKVSLLYGMKWNMNSETMSSTITGGV